MTGLHFSADGWFATGHLLAAPLHTTGPRWPRAFTILLSSPVPLFLCLSQTPEIQTSEYHSGEGEQLEFEPSSFSASKPHLPMFPGTCLSPPRFLHSWKLLLSITAWGKFSKQQSEFLSCRTSITAKGRQVTNTHPAPHAFRAPLFLFTACIELVLTKPPLRMGLPFPDGPGEEGTMRGKARRVDLQSVFLRCCVSSNRGHSARKGLAWRLGVWVSPHRSSLPLPRVITVAGKDACHPPAKPSPAGTFRPAAQQLWSPPDPALDPGRLCLGSCTPLSWLFLSCRHLHPTFIHRAPVVPDPSLHPDAALHDTCRLSETAPNRGDLRDLLAAQSWVTECPSL